MNKADRETELANLFADDPVFAARLRKLWADTEVLEKKMATLLAQTAPAPVRAPVYRVVGKEEDGVHPREDSDTDALVKALLRHTERK